MKKNLIKSLVAGVLGLSALFTSVSCSSSSEPATGGGNGEYKIYLLDKPSTGDWGIWYWFVNKDNTQNEISKNNGPWPTGATSITGKDSYGDFQTIDVPQIDSYKSIGLLFVDRSGSQQTSDVTVSIDDLKKNKTLFFLFSNPKTYYLSFADASGIMSATIDNDAGTTITAVISRLSEIDTSKLEVLDSTDNALSVTSATVDSASKATITLASGDVAKTPYKIKYNGKEILASVKPEVIDSAFEYAGNDLGVSINGSFASFKTWAPTASSVKLALYADASKVSDNSNAEMKDMTREDKGVWSIENVDCSSFKYYKYAITNAGVTKYVSDIWSYIASGDSVASQITDIDSSETKPSDWEASYTNPFGNNGVDSKSYSDAVIYEMHIRDWSRAVVTDSTGKFLDIANSEAIINHLKDIGITHVQLLPVFDYAQTNSDDNYNWGYNPYHYNVPEGRYVTKGYTDGTQAVKEMRQMITRLHEAGIAVIMDVVYNHTSGKEDNSLYDMTVPGYFYYLDDSGAYINYSGCGNAINSDHKMVRKYMIESLKHWMRDYHINGFRFDLMGIHSSETMTAIYEALYTLDKNVLVYGEPWTGGDKTSNGAVSSKKTSVGVGYGAFDDDFRDAIKGAEFGGFNRGQVQNANADSGINKGLKGLSGKNDRNPDDNPNLALHYVECHDNYTLFDKLVYSTLPEAKLKGDSFAPEFKAAYDAVMADASKLASIKAQDKLAAAYIFLAQGTPFINGGQEFLRTKKGDPDSYAADKKGGITWTNTAGEYNIDDVNTIDLSMKTTNSDVYNTYKGLIALRKANSVAFGANENAKATTVSTGVTKYTTGDFCVYFNASDAAANISTTGYTKLVDVTSGTPTESTTVPATVPAKSFVILKK